MGMFDDFKATPVNAKPEDVMAVGAAEKITRLAHDEKYKQMIAKEQADKKAANEMMNKDSRLGEYKLIPLDMLSYSPKAWNQFTPLSDDMKVQMAKSILTTGLQQPIVVREINEEPSGYQILAGNTRTEIYRILLKALGDKRFSTIPAVVYKYGTIDDETAKIIVTDTNYIQRAQLSKKDRAFAIHEKVSYYRKHDDPKALEKVAEELQISKPTAYFWDRVHNLIPEIFDMYDEGQLELRAAARLGVFSPEIQEQLYAEKDFLTNRIVLQIPANTRPRNVMRIFHHIIEKETTPHEEPKPDCKYSVTRTNRTFNVHINGKHKGFEPYVVMLPQDKVNRFLKTYKEFVLSEDEQKKQ